MNIVEKIVFGIIIICCGTGYYFYIDAGQYKPTHTWSSEITAQREATTQEILKPSPTRQITPTDTSELTDTGVFKEINLQRQQEGLPPLSMNARLIKAAEAKADDMFHHQYFEHTSPAGDGPGELAGATGYAYLNIGENLALGNYENDHDLVEAWMNSPGHRENILSSQYTETGVRVQHGVYEGQITWIAVQEFGRPTSACPTPSETMHTQIIKNKGQLTELTKNISSKKQGIDSTDPQYGVNASEKIDTYNKLVDQYNTLVEDTKSLVFAYNIQANAHNICAR